MTKMVECCYCGRQTELIGSCVCTTTMVEETCAGCDRRLTEAEAISYSGEFCFDCLHEQSEREWQAAEDAVVDRIDRWKEPDEEIARRLAPHFNGFNVRISCAFVSEVRSRRRD
jgi:hypothetical protein